MTSVAKSGIKELVPLLRPLLAILMVFMPIVVPSASQAQGLTGQGALTLVRQTSWTIDSPFEIVLSVDSRLPPEEVDIAVTVYGALRSRSQFQEVLDDRTPNSSLVLERQSLAEVLAADRTARVSLPVHDPRERRFYLRDGGVYPVRVDLRSAASGAIIDRLTTHILRVTNTTVAEPLNVATVLPVSAPPGRPQQNSLDLPDNGASVAAVVDTAAQAPDAPLTLLVSPETIERIGANEETRALLTALESLPQSRSLPLTTWVPVHQAIFGEALAGELSAQFDRGANQLRRVSQNQLGDTWYATQPLDTRALNTLIERGYKRFVVRESDLAAIRRDTTLTRPFTFSPGRNKLPVPALQADTGLTNHFTDTADPVLAAHHLLADLAVLYNDRPATRRSAVVMPPDDWRPDTQFLTTYLAALAQAPILRPTSVTEAFAVPAELSGRNALVRQFARADQSELSTEAFQTVRNRAIGFSSMVLPDNPLADELDRTILQAQRAELSAQERQIIRTRAPDLIDRQLSQIDIPPERSLRLTARTGEIPVSVQNETGYPIVVRLRMTSEKLAFTNGESRLLTIERSRITERFAIEAKTTGAFPVDVVVESPDGALQLDRSRVTVRSTAASGVGVGLSVGAGLFLVLWWARSLIVAKRASRARHPVGAGT